jgi:hypothetical protein
LSAITLAEGNDFEDFETSKEMFNADALLGESAVLLFLFFGERIIFARFVWRANGFGVMPVSECLIAAVCQPVSAWRHLGQGRLTEGEVMPASGGDIHTKNVSLFRVHQHLGLPAMMMPPTIVVGDALFFFLDARQAFP